MDEQGIKKARKPRPRYMGVVKSFNRDKGGWLYPEQP